MSRVCPGSPRCLFTGTGLATQEPIPVPPFHFWIRLKYRGRGRNPDQQSPSHKWRQGDGVAVRREQLEPAVESTENFDTSMAQPTDGTLDEAMAQPTDVTFQELRELNLVGARGGAPNDIVMRLANDIANKVQSRQMANTSVRQLADQLGLTPNQGGFRQRAKKLSGAILTYRHLLEGSRRFNMANFSYMKG